MWNISSLDIVIVVGSTLQPKRTSTVNKDSTFPDTDCLLYRRDFMLFHIRYSPCAFGNWKVESGKGKRIAGLACFAFPIVPKNT